MLLRGILKMWSEASVLGDIVLEKKKKILFLFVFSAVVFSSYILL